MATQTQTFTEVEKEEWRRVLCRRKRASGEECAKDEVESDVTRPEDLVGLALSGGGIRSASFNLGLLQAMTRYGYLKQIDLLSTVSGGGYIGSSLTWFCSKLKHAFPFVWSSKAKPEERQHVREHLDELRAHASYLVPGDGLNLWSLLAAILAGSLTTLLVLVPIFIALMAVLSEVVWGKPLLEWMQYAGMILLALFGLGVVAYGILTSKRIFRAASVQRSTREIMGRVLSIGILLFIVGAIPCVYDFIQSNFPTVKGWIFSNVSIAGVISIASGFFRNKPGNEVKPLRSFLLTLGLVLVVYGLFLWFYHLEHQPGIQLEWLPYLCALSLVIAFFANINHVSMHRFYRNRLMEAFMPSVSEVGSEAFNPDQCRLSQITQTAFPYHLINTNIQTVGSCNARLRQRGGGSFLLSPGYCGSDETGYIETSAYAGDTMNLATAMAISGAAADSNSYMTRSRPVTFLMTLFNVRLGYWIRNPKHTSTDEWRKHLKPLWYYYLFRDMFGRGLDENAWNIHLSDGGHFENLGIYELVRRRCKFIIASDAGRDPDFEFADLGRAVERVRADFGVIIDINLSDLQSWTPGSTVKPYAIGTINYGLKENGEKQTGILLLVKSSLIEEMSADVVAYHAQNNSFPDQSTGDQFFDEDQFEAYRELGFQIGKQLLQPKDLEDPPSLAALMNTLLADSTK